MPQKQVSLVAAFRDGLLLLGKRRDNGKWTLADEQVVRAG